MNQRKYAQLIKELEILQAKSVGKAFKGQITLVQKEAVRLARSGKLSSKALKAFMKENNIDLSKFDLSIYDSFLVSEIKLVQSGVKIPAISSMLRRYKNPKTLALKIHKFSLLKLQGSDGSQLKGTEKNIYSQINIHFDEKASELSKIVKDYKKNIKIINNEILSNKSKEIMKYRRSLARVKVKGKYLTNYQIQKRMQSEYSSVDTARVERIYNTELHAQQELISTTRAIQSGFKYKVWNNRPNAGKGGDVRDSHRKLEKVQVKIGKRFRVKGEWAMYPGDPNLSVGERINCRCVLTYTNKEKK